MFSGDTGPYDERRRRIRSSVYGRTRVAAEQLMLARPNTLVVRSGPWIGPSASGRNGHLDWLRSRHARGLPMTVVADEARCAVWAEEAAERVWRLAASSITGIRHLVTPRADRRPELAAYLDRTFAIGARIDAAVPSRSQRTASRTRRVAHGVSRRVREPLSRVVP